MAVVSPTVSRAVGAAGGLDHKRRQRVRRLIKDSSSTSTKGGASLALKQRLWSSMVVKHA